MIGGSTLGIGVTMFLRDQFSGPAAKIKTASISMKKTVDELVNDQLRYTRNLAGGMAMMGAAAAMGMGRAIKEGSKFQYQMKYVGVVSEATEVQTAKLWKEAQRLGTTYMYSSSQVADAMKEMGKAGMKFNEVMANINAAVLLGGATDIELKEAADAMIAIMMQWNLPFSKSKDVADMMAYAVNASTIEMFDLNEAMKYAGATAIDTGAKIEEVTAMIMALGQAGLKGSMAGVAVENALRYMGRAIGKYGTGQQREALAFLGMTMEDVADAAGNVKPMTEIFKAFSDALSRTYGPGMGIEKQGILSEIFGVRGKRAASLLIRNLSQMEGFVKAITTESPDFALKITAERMDTFYGQMVRMGNQWKITWQNMAASLEPIGRGLMVILRMLGKVADFLFRGWQGTVIAAGIAGFIVIKTVALAFKAVLAGLVLMHRELSAASTVFSNSVILGYARMTAAARVYQTAAMGTMTATGIPRGMYGTRGSKGRWGYAGQAFKGKGGFFVKVPSGAWRTFKTAETAGKFARKAYGMRAMGAAAGMGATAAGLGVLARTGATGLIGRLVGILGGPFGIAIAFILPALINILARTLSEHKKSVDDNSRELSRQKAAVEMEDFKYTRMWHMMKFTDINAPAMQVVGSTGREEIMRQLNQSQIQALTDSLRTQLKENRGQDVTLNINLDGDTLLSDRILNLLSKQSADTARKFGF